MAAHTILCSLLHSRIILLLSASTTSTTFANTPVFGQSSTAVIFRELIERKRAPPAAPKSSIIHRCLDMSQQNVNKELDLYTPHLVDTLTSLLNDVGAKKSAVCRSDCQVDGCGHTLWRTDDEVISKEYLKQMSGIITLLVQSFLKHATWFYSLPELHGAFPTFEAPNRLLGLTSKLEQHWREYLNSAVEEFREVIPIVNHILMAHQCLVQAFVVLRPGFLNTKLKEADLVSWRLAQKLVFTVSEYKTAFEMLLDPLRESNAVTLINKCFNYLEGAIGRMPEKKAPVAQQ